MAAPLVKNSTPANESQENAKSGSRLGSIDEEVFIELYGEM